MILETSHDFCLIIDFDEAADMPYWYYFFIYVSLVWISKGHDLFQMKGTDASFVFYTTCFQFITLSKSGSVLFFLIASGSFH